MGKIIVLDDLTACKIAAGEVIERPSSVVKEMLENSIDAGSTSISIEIKAGGVKYIRISDNGKGIEPDDAIIAFDNHATSKICCADDLETVHTLGFRGEALASIASVADVELTSRTADNPQGIYVHIKGGHIESTGSRGSSKGTTFTVSDLFYNTPARYKFLKKDATEAGYIIDIVQRLALAHPEVSLKLISAGITVLHTPGNGDLLSCIYSIYGKEVSSSLKEVKYSDSGVQIHGFTGLDPAVYANRTRQTFFVNGRHIKSKIISASLDASYKTITMKNKFPFCVLSITLSPYNVDVNVHPAKIEVRFSDESLIFKCIYNSIQNAIFARLPIPEAQLHNQLENQLQNQLQKAEQQNQQNQHNYQTELTPIVSDQRKNSDQQYFKTELTTPVFEQKVDCGDQHFLKTEATPTVSDKRANSDQQYFKTELTPPYSAHNPTPLSIPDAAYSSKVPKSQVLEQPQIADILPEPESRPKLFENAIIIGQAFNTYIILQQGDQLLYIDQHAAHERIMYEKIKLAIEEENMPSQMLFLPITLVLAPSEHQILKNNLAFFEKIGFIIEEFGGNSIVIRAVPSIMQNADISTVILSGLGIVQSSSNKNQSLLRNDEAIYTIACKAAVKANKPLGIQEIQELLDNLGQLDNPYSCPHGRPTVIRMSKNELEKKFKRI